MLTLLFLFAMFGLVSFPLAEQLTPAMVNAASNYGLPQIVSAQYAALTPTQKRAVSAAVAFFSAYPTISFANSFVDMMFMPVSWFALLFTAFALFPKTQSNANALLKQYMPCALRLLPPPPSAQGNSNGKANEGTAASAASAATSSSASEKNE